MGLSLCLEGIKTVLKTIIIVKRFQLYRMKLRKQKTRPWPTKWYHPQTLVNTTLHRKLKLAWHELHKNKGEFRCSGRVGNSCSSSDNRLVNRWYWLFFFNRLLKRIELFSLKRRCMIATENFPLTLSFPRKYFVAFLSTSTLYHKIQKGKENLGLSKTVSHMLRQKLWKWETS